MPSLFFGVGICRILRYGSSNTSTVELHLCPRFFPVTSCENEKKRAENVEMQC